MSSNETPTDLSNLIARSASESQSTSVDGTSTTERSLTELIAADEYLRGRRLAKNPAAGIKVFRIRKPE